MKTKFKNAVSETVEKMVSSLIYEAERLNVNLSTVNEENWQSELDDLFNDGGEIRCESFVDIAYNKALELGAEFESNDMMNFGLTCAIKAINKISKKLNNNQ